VKAKDSGVGQKPQAATLGSPPTPTATATLDSANKSATKEAALETFESEPFIAAETVDEIANAGSTTTSIAGPYSASEDPDTEDLPFDEKAAVDHGASLLAGTAIAVLGDEMDDGAVFCNAKLSPDNRSSTVPGQSPNSKIRRSALACCLIALLILFTLSNSAARAMGRCVPLACRLLLNRREMQTLRPRAATRGNQRLWTSAEPTRRGELFLHQRRGPRKNRRQARS